MFSTAYSYDQRGNILTKTKVYDDTSFPAETTNFSYSNSAWPDELTSVNGTSLTYDANGNVLTYGNMEFEWTNGRTLSQITVNPEDENGTADVYSYTYDESGIRSSKTVNGVTTYFTTKDGVILSQTDGTNTMYFQYDNSGVPVGVLINGVQYFYITNQMNDIIGITDNAGSLIATYTYGAWGEVLAVTPATTGNSAQLAIANANPLRYRGYYRDQETGYYYLQSRYYMPCFCRFFNSDYLEGVISLKNNYSGSNLFVYCSNNAINLNDEIGMSEETAFKGLYALMINPVRAILGYRYNVSTKKFVENEIVIPIRKYFLSRPNCTSYANKIIKTVKGNKKTRKYASGNKVLGMTAHRMAVEMWAHALGFFCGKGLVKINKNWGGKLLDSGKQINLNKNDPREKYYYAIWAAGSGIKAKLLLSKSPSVAKYAASIVL